MNGADVIDIAKDAITTLLMMVGPILGIALSVGLMIAFFQALTQIQEMTLTFVPKIVAIFFSLMLLLPYMGTTIGSLMTRLADRIAGG